MDVQSEQTKRRPADESLAQARESRGAVRREERPEVGAALEYLGAPTPRSAAL